MQAPADAAQVPQTVLSPTENSGERDHSLPGHRHRHEHTLQIQPLPPGVNPHFSYSGNTASPDCDALQSVAQARKEEVTLYPSGRGCGRQSSNPCPPPAKAGAVLPPPTNQPRGSGQIPTEGHCGCGSHAPLHPLLSTRHALKPQDLPPKPTRSLKSTAACRSPALPTISSELVTGVKK